MGDERNPEYIGIQVDIESVESITFEGYAEADGYEEDTVVAYLGVQGNHRAIDWIARCWTDDSSPALHARAELWVPLSDDDATPHTGPAVQIFISCDLHRSSAPAEALMLVLPLMRQHLLVSWAGAYDRFMICVDVAQDPRLEVLYSGSRDDEGRGGLFFPVDIDPYEVQRAELAAWRTAYAGTIDTEN